MISGRKTDAPFPDVFAGWLVLVCCMAMPAFVVISTRSSLAILSGFSFAAALALATRCGRTWLQEMLHSIRTPEGRLILVGFTFSAVSLVWGASGWNGAFALGEVFLAVLSALAFGVVLYHCAPWIRPGQIAAAISAGLLTGAAIFIYLTIIGHPLRSLNRAALSWTVLLWPLVGFLVCRGKGALGALVILAGLALAYLSDSTRSVFGLILGAAVFALATVAPRFASRAFLVMVIVLLIGAPWFGKIVERGMPDSLHSYISMRKASTKERVNVWVGMGILATAHFPKGAGFASSPQADADPAAALVPAEIRPMLAVGHPHNMFLQVWYELGAVGVLVVLGAAFAMHRRLQQLAADAVPAFLGLATVIVAEGYVGHGAWQGWWWAVCGLAAFSLAHCQGLLRPLPAQASAAAVSPPRQARSLARVRTVALSLAVVTFVALFVPPALLYIQHALGAVNRPLAYVFVLQVCLVAVIAFLLVTFLPRREFAITSALQVSTLAFATFAMALLVFRSFYSLAMLFSAFILVVSINAVLASRRTYLNTGGAAVFLSGAEGSLPPNLAHQLRKVTDPSAPVTGVSLVVMDLQRQPAPDWSEYLNRAIAAGIEVVHLPSFLQFHQRWV